MKRRLKRLVLDLLVFSKLEFEIHETIMNERKFGFLEFNF